jgi:hypothetical protein
MASSYGYLAKLHGIRPGAKSPCIGSLEKDEYHMKGIAGVRTMTFANPDDISSVSGQIFEGIRFIRLSQWKECGRSTVLAGGVSCAGQIFRRFELKNDSNVVLEFWFRGVPLEDASANTFAELLADLGDVTEAELESVADVWQVSVGAYLLSGTATPAQKPLEIDAAEVGELNGRRILAIWWRHSTVDRKYLSMFMDAEDGPGKLIHEIHFSAPAKEMQRHSELIVETLRSFQWTRALPPPIVSSRMSA